MFIAHLSGLHLGPRTPGGDPGVFEQPLYILDLYVYRLYMFKHTSMSCVIGRVRLEATPVFLNISVCCYCRCSMCSFF